MADWHPILVAREVTPGHWYMIDGVGKPYGQIRLVRRGDDIGYRADRCDDHADNLELVGYFRTLKAAATQVHRLFLRSHGAPSSREYGR
ncbi:MAG: hypothetical protein JWQ43_1802 [Glaciihabitans sp.]|nr:hypothetical protein [Glaciihabitans sp.]